MPNAKTVWIRVLTIGGFIGWLVSILGFFGIDAKTLVKAMTTHYLLLLLALAFFAAFVWGIYLWWRSSGVTTHNIEQKVRQWTDAFRFPSKILTNEKLYFGISVELPSKLRVAIRRSKDHPSYLTLRSRIGTTEKQRAVFDKMSEKTQESVLRTIQLECSRFEN